MTGNLAWIGLSTWVMVAAVLTGLYIGDLPSDGPDWLEVLAIATWPMALPLVYAVHWWRWGKCGLDGPLRRYTDTPWWSRGEPPRERRGTPTTKG